ncbi:hypothetical protein XJ44_01545 [Thermosipho affectus]|uniref:Tetratricopeptide repeat protein n=2 Tax=Fervidobacteriaceae TaxID=1643950 RepID=A0ABX3IIN6_9BACT|nr:hypothetical protein Y592_01565 [Thermosipho sp. 1070]ONN27689.1 hypothetical protein XJ44_01545 [Thermosipho affectus]OOC45178.1 hypothetical protein XO08_01555 [Thermosipho sp. 1074]
MGSGGKMKKIIIILLMISIFSFSISKNEIIELSKKNPELSWKKYLEYVLENPTDTSIEKLGKKIKIKIQIKDKENLNFLIKEDINGLRNYLKETSPSTKILNLINFFFPQVESLVKDSIENPKYDSFAENIIFLKITDPKIETKKAAKELTNFFLKYPTMLTYNVVSLFKNKSFSKDLGFNILNYIVQNINNFDEEKYPILNRIVDFSKSIGGTYTSKYLLDLEKYVEILEKINENKIENVNLEKLQINNLSIKKDILLQKISKYNSPHIINKTNNTKNELKPSKSSNTFELFLLIILFGLISSFRIVRFYIFYTLRLKKIAALTYKKIVEKDPMNEEKHLKLAQLYEEAGMYDEALQEYNLIKRIKI